MLFTDQDFNAFDMIGVRNPPRPPNREWGSPVTAFALMGSFRIILVHILIQVGL